MHKPEVYRKFVIEQYNNIKQMIEKGNKPEIRKYLRNYDIIIENCDSACIYKWNVDAQAIDKNTK